MAHLVSCLYCTKDFTAHRASALYCSNSCRVRASRDRNYMCFYCGDRANQRDHVIPHAICSAKVRQWSEVDLVECCAECNRILGANLFDKMHERVQYLSRRFRQKHKLARAHIEWSEGELRELSTSLRDFVQSGERLYWARWRRWQHMILREAQLRDIEAETAPE